MVLAVPYSAVPMKIVVVMKSNDFLTRRDRCLNAKQCQAAGVTPCSERGNQLPVAGHVRPSWLHHKPGVVCLSWHRLGENFLSTLS